MSAAFVVTALRVLPSVDAPLAGLFVPRLPDADAILVAVGLVSTMYLCFVLSYAELSCAIPRAGGAFVYADRALGRDVGFVA